jgi:hypothetical protein
MKKSKDFSDFFSVEYESIAQAHFNAHEILSRWVRFYFLVVAAPLTLLAILSTKNQPIDILYAPLYLSIIFALVGILAFDFDRWLCPVQCCSWISTTSRNANLMKLTRRKDYQTPKGGENGFIHSSGCANRPDYPS